jgi:hypothetical protein
MKFRLWFALSKEKIEAKLTHAIEVDGSRGYVRSGEE